MITLAQLRKMISPAEVESTLLTFLTGLGFQATSWQEGSIQRTIVQGFSDLIAGVAGVVSQHAVSFSPRLATTDYQNILGEHTYDLPRVGAKSTEGVMRLTLSVAASPVAWDADEIVIASAPEDPAQTYRVRDAGSLNPGQSASVEVYAEIPGAAGNLPNNTPLFLWTQITGLSATNPTPSGSSSWIVTPGQDAESNERYADRMTGRWHRLTYANTEGAYRAWALEALPELTRVRVFEGDPAGQVRVIGATATGGLSGAQSTQILLYLLGVTDGVGRRPINDDVQVASATVKTTPSILLTVQCESAFAATAAARVTDALVQMLGEIPIGGEQVGPTPGGYVLASRIYQTVMAQQGIRNVTGVPADILLAETEIYTPAITVNVVEV